jgi:cytoskeletal protein CcmA (bactofilin family)
MFKRKGSFDPDDLSPSLNHDYHSSSATSAYTPSRETPPRIFETRPPLQSPMMQPPLQMQPSPGYSSMTREEPMPVLEDDFEDEYWKKQSKTNSTPLHAQPNSLDIDEPETVLGEGVVIKGQLRFRRFLRIDGEFEGELISEGKLIIGPTGVVRSHITLREAIIEGRVEGNITVKERLEVRGEAKIYGNIQARLLTIDEGAVVMGQVAVKPMEEGQALEEQQFSLS